MCNTDKQLPIQLTQITKHITNGRKSIYIQKEITDAHYAEYDTNLIALVSDVSKSSRRLKIFYEIS